MKKGPPSGFAGRSDAAWIESASSTPAPEAQSPRSVRRAALGRLLALALCGFAHAALAAGADERPKNVLFLISDDLNCDLGCYGRSGVHSPNIDRLAAKGMRFDRAYVQYTVCNPSRTSFLTGLRPETTGVFTNEVPFRSRLPDAATLPELFRRGGWFCGGLGKVFHRGLSPDEIRPERDDPRSWDRTFYGRATQVGNRGAGRNMSGGSLAWCRWLAAEGADEDQADGQIAREAVRWIEQSAAEPFFLAVGFYRPHDPFQSPAKYFDLYPLDSLEPPAEPDDRSEYVRHAIPGGRFGNAFVHFTDQDKREFLRAYYAGVSFMDAQVGRILDALDRLNLWDSTIVVFIGDHGYELGVRNWWGKNTLYERSCRTPLIVWAPGAGGMGRSCRSLVEYIDLYPTLADLCGLEPDRSVEGRSFRRLLEDPSLPGKPVAYTVLQRGPGVQGRSVRTDRYRYTEWNEGREGVELYDHHADPGEWKNLADDPVHAPARSELSALLLRQKPPGAE